MAIAFNIADFSIYNDVHNEALNNPYIQQEDTSKNNITLDILEHLRSFRTPTFKNDSTLQESNNKQFWNSNINVNPNRQVATNKLLIEPQYTTIQTPFLSHTSDKDHLYVDINNINVSDELVKNKMDIEGKYESDDGLLVAKIETKLGEDWATGPYGMTTKKIDQDLFEKTGQIKRVSGKEIHFKDGEKVSKAFAEANLREGLKMRAETIARDFLNKGIQLNQHQLDAITCCGGTWNARQTFYKFLLENWGQWDKISEFWKQHAIRSKNGVKQGLITRRQFESNWFTGDSTPYKTFLQQNKHKK